MSVRAKVYKQFEHLKGVFDLHDEVEIIPKLSTERRVVSTKRIETWEGKPYASKLLKSIVVDDVVAEIGSYLGFTVKSKNGKEYGDKTFHSMLGYVTLDKIFVKI